MKKDPCDKRKGILEALQEGVWKPVAFNDPQLKEPTVFDCKHDADRAITELVAHAMRAGLLSVFQLQEEPQFRFTVTDAVPDDAPVTDTKEACVLLAPIMRKR